MNFLISENGNSYREMSLLDILKTYPTLSAEKIVSAVETGEPIKISDNIEIIVDIPIIKS